MPRLEKISYMNLGDILEQERDDLAIVKFYSNKCFMCHNLAPFYDKMPEKYEDVQFYVFNVEDIDEITAYIPQIDGTPSFMACTKSGNVKFLEDPPEPNKKTWYHEQDIVNFIERHREA